MRIRLPYSAVQYVTLPLLGPEMAPTDQPINCAETTARERRKQKTGNRKEKRKEKSQLIGGRTGDETR